MESSSLNFDEANKRSKDRCLSWTCINIFNKRKSRLTNYNRITTNNNTISTTRSNGVESFCELWSLNTPECHQHTFGSKKLLLPIDSSTDHELEEEEDDEQGKPLTLAQHLSISKHAHIKNKNSWGWLVKGKSEANRKFKIQLEESIIWKNKKEYFHDQHNAILSITRLAAACSRPTTASSKPLLIRSLSNQININGHHDHHMTDRPNGVIVTPRLSDPESLRAGVEVFVVSSGKPELKWVTVYRKHKQLTLSFRKKYMSGIITAMKEYKIVTIVVEGNQERTGGYSELCLKTSDGIVKLLFRDEKQKMIWASTISNLLHSQDFCS